MIQCHYSTEVSGHYGKSLKDNALLFLGFFLGGEGREVVWGVCVCFILFCLGLFVLIWVFFIPRKVPALGW